eukprot:gene48337-59198_t
MLAMKDTSVMLFRLPDMSVFRLDTSGLSQFLVKDLKLLLHQRGIGFPPERIKLVFRQRLLEDIEFANELRTSELYPIEVIARVCEDGPLLVSWTDFLVATYPRPSAIHVPVNVTIKLTLQASPSGLVVYLPSLCEHTYLRTLLPTQPSQPSSEPALASERVLLLQIDSSMELRLEALLRGVGEGGAAEAGWWSAYSSQPPLPC